ncbi:hypothetical protein Pelo_5603 [Pelomyxa schiedti]|nr:hypothetical protein Pelo_5603 [Pelomyxa schiedti]
MYDDVSLWRGTQQQEGVEEEREESSDNNAPTSCTTSSSQDGSCRGRSRGSARGAARGGRGGASSNGAPAARPRGGRGGSTASSSSYSASSSSPGAAESATASAVMVAERGHELLASSRGGGCGNCTKCGRRCTEPGHSLCKACYGLRFKKTVPVGTVPCAECGVNMANEGFNFCEECFLRAEQAGLCRNCHQEKKKPGSGMCYDCYADTEEANLCHRCQRNQREDKRHKWCHECFAERFLCIICHTAKRLQGSKTCSSCVPDTTLRPPPAMKEQRLIQQFYNSWVDPRRPTVIGVYGVWNTNSHVRHLAYNKTLPPSARKPKVHLLRLWHGTTMQCDVWAANKTLCTQPTCAVCNIGRTGFDIRFAAAGEWGRGLYFAHNASKAHGFATGSIKNNICCLFLCKVTAGVSKVMPQRDRSLAAPPNGFHSVLGTANPLPELIVYDRDAALPAWLVFYQLN